MDKTKSSSKRQDTSTASHKTSGSPNAKSSLYWLIIPLLLASPVVWRIFALLPRLVPPTLPSTPQIFHPSSSDPRDARSECRILTSVADDRAELKFCEDITTWEGTEFLIASCDPGRGNWNTVMGPLKDPNPRGKLWTIDSASTSRRDTQKIRPLALHGFPESHDFHPLGIRTSTLPGIGDGPTETLLLAVNHQRNYSTIEVFTLSRDESQVPRANYITTLRHPSIYTPNGLVVLGVTHVLSDSGLTQISLRVLMTNDHFATRRTHPAILPQLETLLALPGGNVVSLDVKLTLPAPAKPAIAPVIDVQKVLDWIPFANGIALSPDGSKVAVAECSLNQVSVYSLSQAGPLGAVGRPSVSLALVSTHSVPFYVDNLSWDHPDSLLAAGHPNGLGLIAIAKDPYHRGGGKVKSGSWVVELAVGGSGEEDGMRKRTVFWDDGSWFGTSSTGVRMGEKIYVSGLYETGILECNGVFR